MSGYTPLLGLIQPDTGSLNGTWGTAVNNQITQLIEDSIAGYATASVTSGDWTLTDSDGATDTGRMAILIATGAPGTTRNIFAPAQSKIYVVINDCSDYSTVNISGGTSGSHTTGVQIAGASSAVVAWDSTTNDFVLISGNGGGATGGGTNQIFFLNEQTVTFSYAVPSGKNAGTFGPVTINSGVTVTVPDGSVWTVV